MYCSCFEELSVAALALAESLLEETLLLLLFRCNRSCGRWQTATLRSKGAVGTTELDGCANRRRLRLCGSRWVSTSSSISVAVRHSVTAIRIASILLHDRSSIVDIVTIWVILPGYAIGTVQRAVLTARVCRVSPGSGAVAVLCTCVVRVVVAVLRIETVCAVGAARVHTSCVLVAAGRSSRDTNVGITILATGCIVTATVLVVVVCVTWSGRRSVLQKDQILTVATVKAASTALVIVVVVGIALYGLCQ